MSKRQVPRGDEDMVCPLHKASMDTVCHKCPLWQSVKGRHPQTGADLDQWACAIAILPMLMINVAKETREGAAATESLRNVVDRGHAAGVVIAIADLVGRDRDGGHGSAPVASEPRQQRLIGASG